MSKTSEIEDCHIVVLSDDQNNINAFSCLNQRLQELKLQHENINEEIQRLKDADEEVLISMESDGILLSLGECFIPSTDDEAASQIGITRSLEEAKLVCVTKEMDKIQQDMSVLKTKLYGKFGKVINLEA